MKKATLVLLLVPALLFGTSLLETFQQLAHARPVGAAGGRGGGSISGRGAGGGMSGARSTYGGGSSYRGGSYRGSGTGGYVRGGGSYAGGGGGHYRGGGSYYRGGGYYRGDHGGHWHGRHASHFSTSIWLGPGFLYDPFFYPWYSPFYPYYYPYYAPPSTTVVVPREPQEYIMSEPQQEEKYWYYCKDKDNKGYYPYVKRCPGGWMRVVPSPSPPEPDEDEDQED